LTTGTRTGSSHRTQPAGPCCPSRHGSGNVASATNRRGPCLRWENPTKTRAGTPQRSPRQETRRHPGVRKLLGSHQSPTPTPVQHRRGAQGLRDRQWPFLLSLCLASLPPLLPSDSGQGGWRGFRAHPALGCAAEQGRDREALEVSPGLRTGWYLSAAKRSTPAPSPASIGGCIPLPRHRQRPGTARRGEGLVEARRQRGCGGISRRRGSVRDGAARGAAC